MAHGIYLSDDELKVFKEKEVGISHCPSIKDYKYFFIN